MSEVGAARTLEAALFGTEGAAAADDSIVDSSVAHSADASAASPVSGPGNASFNNSSIRSTAAPPPPPPPPPRRPTADYTGVRSTASSGSATSPTTVAAASDLFSLFSTAPPTAAAAAAAAAAETGTAAQSRTEKHAARHAAAALRTRKKAAGAGKRRGKLQPQPRQTHYAPGYVGVTWPREDPQALLDEQEHREWVSCFHYDAQPQSNVLKSCALLYFGRVCGGIVQQAAPVL
jgi:hypothetical protein